MIGAVLIVAGIRNHVSEEVALLAVGSALGLAGVEVWYVARRVIPPVYLLDAAAEAVLVGLWVFGLSQGG